MTRRAVGAAIVCGAILLAVVPVCAGGFSFGLLGYTADLADAFGNVSIAAEGAFDVLDGAFVDFGLPPGDRAAVREQFDDALGEMEGVLADAPTVVPVPLLGGSIEISLPLLVIDGVRVAGGFLTDAFVRGIAELAGVPIPEPIVDVELDAGDFAGSLEADVSFASWMVRTEVTKRFDLLVAALDLALGVHLVRGEVTPRVEIDVSPEYETAAAGVVGALHLDGLTWSAFGVHASAGIEVGPPFLRIGVTAHFVLPIAASSGWWGIDVGSVGGSLGMVIRF